MTVFFTVVHDRNTIVETEMYGAAVHRLPDEVATLATQEVVRTAACAQGAAKEERRLSRRAQNRARDSVEEDLRHQYPVTRILSGGKYPTRMTLEFPRRLNSHAPHTPFHRHETL
jgi:hypothetical protein